MTKADNPKRKKSSTKSAATLVVFRVQVPQAQTVSLAGSFNDWDPTQAPMSRDGDDCWQRIVALPPGRHEYRFVVDGQWVDDPNAKEFAPNAHGSRNAVAVV